MINTLVKTLLGERAALVEEVRSIHADATLPTAEKQSRIKALNVEIAAKADEARGYVEQAERESDVRSLAAGNGFSASMLTAGGNAGSEVRHNEPLPAGRGFSDLPGAKAATRAEFGEYVRALVYEGRAAAEGTDSAGGFLVPTKYASGVLDLARTASRGAGVRRSIKRAATRTGWTGYASSARLPLGGIT